MNLCFVLIWYSVPLPYIVMLNVWMLESSEVLWYYRSSSDMASFKPTKVQFLPKLGETVTEETLYWKKYKVWDVLDTFSKVYVQRKVYVCVLISHHFLQVFSIHIHCFVFQSPVQIKEFGAITKIDFSPLPPHNYAVTASTRVSPIHFLSY